jgi:DNA-binding GntR family transcriptional regulator
MAYFKQVQHISDQVVNNLRQLILDGHFMPGERLPQEELASQLGISVIPLREGLMKLHTENLIDLIPHRGAFVKTFNADQIEELYRMREELEVLAIEWAIPKLSPQQIERARQLLSEAEQLVQAGGDLHRRTWLVRLFYQVIFEATGRFYLYEAITRYYNMIYLYVRQYLSTIDLFSLHHIYREFLSAIEARDTQKATTLHRLSHRLVREALVTAMREREQTSAPEAPREPEKLGSPGFEYDGVPSRASSGM